MKNAREIRAKFQSFMDDHLYLLKAKLSFKKKTYLVSYFRSGNSLVRTYFSILQGRPQLSVYKGDVIREQNEPLTKALDHINLIKSHTFNPEYEDVVYIARDGRNAMISHLYMTFLWGGHNFSKLEDIYEGIRHLSGQGHFWGDHVKEALSEAVGKNVLLIKYENLTNNPAETLKKITNFMGVDLSDDTINRCVGLARESKSYFENPHNGYTYEPEENSIYHFLKKHRSEDYWKKIFDDRTKRYFHERGGTEFLLKFGYEQSDDWWKR
ncbi:MAG: sulfotransferase domain-containing protein [Thermodesulfobacteriota bacterium]